MADDLYASYDDENLIELLFTAADGLPRAAVDEFIARGARLIPRLTQILEDPRNWADDDGWTQTHAAYILGAIGGDAALPGLLAALRHSQTDDFTYDELNEELPWMFASIGLPAVDPLIARSREAKGDSYERRDCLTALSCIAKLHPARREEILDLLRDVCADEREPLATRGSAGCELLDFARPQDRDLLMELGRLQKGPGSPDIFHPDSVADQYEKGPDLRSPPPLDWLRAFDPPEEAPDEADDYLREFDPGALDVPAEPVRVGRNDPCPCGSGKKYKKCCEE